MVSVEPSSRTSGCKKISPTAISSVPASSARKNPVAAMRSASSVFWLPRAREIKLPEPWPNMKPKAWMMAIRGKATPTAAVALVASAPPAEIWPTKNVSAML